MLLKSILIGCIGLSSVVGTALATGDHHKDKNEAKQHENTGHSGDSKNHNHTCTVVSLGDVDYTRLRADLTTERSRHAQRLEKLLEDALIKVSTVATDLMDVSGRAMIEALIASERDPQVLAELARGRLGCGSGTPP
jgi:hypothetical protein